MISIARYGCLEAESLQTDVAIDGTPVPARPLVLEPDFP